MSDTVFFKAPRNVLKATLSNSSQVAANPAVLYGISGYNSGAAQFIQLHDLATTPADTAVPALNIAGAAASNYSIDFGVYGMAFAAGIFVEAGVA